MKRFLTCLAGTIFFAALLTSSQAATYRMRELSLPENCIASIVSAISNDGVIVGGVWDNAGHLYSAKWSADGTIAVDFADLPSHMQSEALAINERGQVISSVITTDYNGHGVLSNPDGTWTDIGSLGGGYTVAWGINDLGQVVGWSRTAARQDHAFIWSKETGMIDISGGNYSIGYAINNSGLIAGLALPAGSKPDDPVQWSAANPGSRAFVDEPRCVNQQGQAGGYLFDHAVIWNPDGTKTDLGPGEVAGINNLGQAVGLSDHRAVLWNPSGEMTILDSIPDSGFMRAIDINDSGIIVGYGMRSYQYVSAVWEPVPEPSSLVALLLGLTSVAGLYAKSRK